MSTIENILTEHLDIWTSTIKSKSSAGRGSGKKQEFYGIKKLRELILELAVRGLLVPQDPQDEPASELLKIVAKERTLLAKEGKIKKLASISPIDKMSSQYPIPKGWVWARIGTIGNVFNGNSISAHVKETKYTNVKGRPYIATKDVSYGFEPLDYQNGVAIPENEEKFQVARIGSILICAEGGSAGKKCGIAEKEICFGNKLFATELFAGILSKYILSVYISQTFYKAFTNSMTGIIGGISKSKFETLLCPLPPLAEQHRIVAKVDELMALCDKLEQQQEDSQSTHAALVETLLAALTNAGDHRSFNEAWQRIATNFDILFTTESSIDQLKQTILQLAVMGKLVEQNPEDEPAEELLKKIAIEKAKLIKGGKLRNKKKLPQITPTETLFEIPSSWLWVRLGDILKKITDGTHHSPANGEHGDYLYISAKNIKPEGVQISNATWVTKEIHEEIYSRCDPEFGDILYIKDGATTGITTINNIEVQFSMLSSVALLKCSSGILNTYLLLSLRSPYFYQEMRSEMTGVAITRVTLKKLDYAYIALPPLSEQRRIVAKVDELMALCDRLKASLQSAETTQLQLADSLVEKAIQ